jgi:hypothetical protein
MPEEIGKVSGRCWPQIGEPQSPQKQRYNVPLPSASGAQGKE